MTDAWATIIASIISAIVSGLIAFIGIATKHPRTKRRFVGFTVLGLCVGAVLGVIVGYFLLVKPKPSARIIAPTNGQSVPIYAKVTFEYNNIPRDRHLWLVVRIPGVGATPWLIYPQLQGMENIKKNNGVVDFSAAFGGDKDKGRPYNIAVLLVNEDANLHFVDYADSCKRDSNLCNGMIKPEKGVDILDFDTVIRQ